MRIECPLCGERGSEEFTYLGGLGPKRPQGDATEEAWLGYTYFRDNPAGLLTEYWHHRHGCRAWLLVTRDTRNHTVQSVHLARQTEPIS